MAQWYVKELSKLTKVSVRTLHHYDQIGLLKPSVRLLNGYRLYSEADLLKLQQIIALKFFGFELSIVKALMQGEINIFDHFRAQRKFLEQKVQSLQEATQALEAILCESKSNKSIPWEMIIKIIEVYQMTKELENPWVAKVLNPEELKEYADFQQSLKTRFTAGEKSTFEKEWASLVKQIEANLNKDPTSDFGMDVGKRCMDMVNGMYGKEHAALRTTIWEKGYKQAQMEGEHSLSPQVVDWLDKATGAYYQKRIYSVLSQVETTSLETVSKLWEGLQAEMHGDNQEQRAVLIDAALKDGNVSAAAKNWLKRLM